MSPRQYLSISVIVFIPSVDINFNRSLLVNCNIAINDLYNDPIAY
jgi:hypothetical protein